MIAYPFYHTYVENRFACENTFGARFCQPWPWAHYNHNHPGPESEKGPPGHRPDRWPTFADARPLLPQPFWSGHEDAIACYWRAWELAFGNFRRATPENRFVCRISAPAFNASVDPLREEILYKKFYNIGIAVDSGRGLVVPVIRGADRKTIVQIAEAIEDLARRGREGKLEVEDLRGGTFTITNVGPLGGTALIPIINYPETAILGMGRVQERPVVRDGQIVIRRILPLTLAFDHRVADGADAARFVNTLTRLLSDPRELLMQT
jgi:hypothetical protein